MSSKPSISEGVGCLPFRALSSAEPFFDNSAHSHDGWGHTRAKGGTIARTILVASSLWLAVLGGALLFFPDVCADLLSLPDGSARALPLVGGGHLGFAMMNWTGRGAVYGGIYGRPIVVGNFANAVITSSALMRTQMDEGSTVGWLVVVALLLYTVAFARLTFWPPFRQDHESAG